jgi:putative transposase
MILFYASLMLFVNSLYSYISIKFKKYLKIWSLCLKKSDYTSKNRSKHYLKCHLIFVCKYRKRLLIGQLKDDMHQIILNIAFNSDFEIEVFESDIDDIHFLIRYIPRISITSIVRKLKQEPTYHIWSSCHKALLVKHF